MGHLLHTFDGGPIGYWHDCGHAHAQELFGLATQQQWLQRFRENLVGMHLHDAQGLRDHLPPGSGEIDLPEAVKALDSQQPAVIELAPGTGLGDIEKGMAYLSALNADPSGD